MNKITFEITKKTLKFEREKLQYNIITTATKILGVCLCHKIKRKFTTQEIYRKLFQIKQSIDFILLSK